MNHRQNKLENSARLADLSPQETLLKIGLGEHDIMCDIGAGSGIFTVPAARITKNAVYAIEINDEFIDIINEKARSEKLSNIKTLRVSDDHYDLDTASVDLAVLVTVFHEIDQKEPVLAEIKRVLKSTGKLAFIEFHKRETPMGPPVEHRISREEVIRICGANGFLVLNEFDVGDNFYCIVTGK